MGEKESWMVVGIIPIHGQGTSKNGRYVKRFRLGGKIS